MKHGLICGRFQPFHNGHYKLVQTAIEQCDVLTIVVGSAQESGTDRNPISFEWREQMIMKACESLGERIGKCVRVSVMGLADLNDPPRWARYLVSSVEEAMGDPVNVYFAGSEEDAAIMRSIPSLEVVVVQRGDLSATAIRAQIASGSRDWVYSVPRVLVSDVEELLCPVRK